MKQPYFQVTGNIHFNQLLKRKGLTAQLIEFLFEVELILKPHLLPN